MSDTVTCSDFRVWEKAAVPGTRVPLLRVRELFDAGYSVPEIGGHIYPHLGANRVLAALGQCGVSFDITGMER